MTFIDLYLKAKDENAMLAALKVAGVSRDPEGGQLHHEGSAISIVGVIQKPTGEKVLVDGIEQEVMKPVDGYHVNVRTTSQELAYALDALRTYPDTPVRVWA